MNEENKAGAGQYLTFKLGDKAFAIEILQVREVLEYTTITKGPGTPDFLRGVINLRGSGVPVIDLRLKFAMDKTEHQIDTCPIIYGNGVRRIPRQACHKTDGGSERLEAMTC